jgi:hypothetical protein
VALKVASSNLATHLISFKERKNIKHKIKSFKVLKINKTFIFRKQNLIMLDKILKMFTSFNVNHVNTLKVLKSFSNYVYINYFNLNLNFFKKKIDSKSVFYLIILNLKYKKPFVNVMLNKQNKIALSTGIVLRYLNIKEKKLRKKLSSLYLMLKIILIMLQKPILSLKKIIFEIKGLRKDMYLIIKFLKSRLLFNNLIIIHTPNLSHKSLKYKKIRAIKKNLKKKLIKID